MCNHTIVIKGQRDGNHCMFHFKRHQKLKDASIKSLGDKKWTVMDNLESFNEFIKIEKGSKAWNTF